MPLILELLAYFGVGFAGGLVYQIGVRKRPIAEALHLAAIFGLAIILIAFIVLFVVDVATR